MIAGLIFAATLATMTATTTLHGTVVLRHHGVEDPLGGAIVQLDWHNPPLKPLQAITATDGSFEFPGVVIGEHEIGIYSSYDPIVGDISVVPENGEPPRKFIALDPTCWAASGRVRDSSTGDPVANATITYLGTGKSDVNGDYFIDWGCGPVQFRFHNTFQIFAFAPGYFDFSMFFGRAESVSSSRVHDFELWHLPFYSPCCGHDPELRIK